MFHYQRMLLLRINEVNDDVLAQVITGINSRPIRASLQLDESTNVSNISQLFLVFVNYIKDTPILDEFLFCEKLKLTTRAADVFEMLSDLLKAHGIRWNKTGSI